jgi:hypothetical protein
MIDFRCWYCNKRHQFPREKIGQRFKCSCAYNLCVPRKSGGNCRSLSLLDLFLERIVYALGGAFIGLVVGLVAARSLLVGFHLWQLLATLIAMGFVLGAVGGEAGIRALRRMLGSKDDR